MKETIKNTIIQGRDAARISKALDVEPARGDAYVEVAHENDTLLCMAYGRMSEATLAIDRYGKATYTKTAGGQLTSTSLWLGEAMGVEQISRPLWSDDEEGIRTPALLSGEEEVATRREISTRIQRVSSFLQKYGW